MKGSRLITGVILGILITVGAHFAAPLLCIAKGRLHLIQIGPRAQDISRGEEEAYISLGGKHQITWQSTDGRPLIIEFDKASLNGKDPFEKMTDSPDGKYRRVYCKDDACRSGNINPALDKDLGFLKCLRFKYYQQIGEDRADGWIIIKP
jgi:hypothetical protein